MKRAKYLFVLLIGCLVYVGLSLTVGQNGFHCYRQLEEQKRIVYKQKMENQKINSELEMEKNAMTSDYDMIAAYARKLDYVKDGEKLIKINGAKPASSDLYYTGAVVVHEEPEFVSEAYCKMCSILISVLMALIMFIFDIKNGNIFVKQEKNITPVAGIPIYDLPQV